MEKVRNNLKHWRYIIVCCKIGGYTDRMDKICRISSNLFDSNVYQMIYPIPHIANFCCGAWKGHGFKFCISMTTSETIIVHTSY